MLLFDQPPAVQKLATLGDGWGQPPEEWVDYRALGITPEQIPALIEILKRAEEFWVDELEDDPRSWTPMHAWRALGQLQAGEAAPAMVNLLHLIDDEDYDLIDEDMPYAFGLMGPAAIQPLAAYLDSAENPMWARITAAESLKEIGLRHPTACDEAVLAMTRVLERYPENEILLNSYIIYCLAQLKAAQSAPLVEQVFLAERVDESVFGDWQDFQVLAGLLEKRLTPRESYRMSPTAFSDGAGITPDPFYEPPTEEERNARKLEEAAKKKEKNKLKQAKAQRKKNKKKKK